MNSDASAAIYIVDENVEKHAHWLSELRSNDFVVHTPDSNNFSLSSATLQRPCVVVIDLETARNTGWLVETDVPPIRYEVPVILVADDCTTRDAINVMEHGALTLLKNPLNLERLRPYIERAIHEDRRNALLNYRYSETHQAIEDLTQRQRTILSMVAEGKTTKQIAMLLDVSVRLVEQERSTILRQFKVLSTPEVTVKIGEFRALRLMSASARQATQTDDAMGQFLDRF